MVSILLHLKGFRLGGFSPVKRLRPTVPKTTARPILVVISCGCCFLQSCIAFAIMLPILYQRRCCVTFLKMQFCSATSMAMAIFILGLLQLFPPYC
uniref:Uncharacterized protein n=1 Tax=Anopheles stephensi TaxID=30069 RepID=A0A182YDF1_ANOST